MATHVFAEAGIESTPISREILAFPTEPRNVQLFRQILDVSGATKVVELGSWEGRSALGWALAAQSLERDVWITCVDTWLGSVEHWMDDFPDSEWSRDRLRIIDGSPQVFTTFCSTVTAHNLNQVIAAFPGTTRTAADLALRLGSFADVVYVDAAHDFRSVLGDLQDALHISGRAGLLVGDDWGWKSVRKAVRVFSKLHRVRVLVNPTLTNYAIGFGPNRALSGKLVTDYGWSKLPLWR